MIDLNQGGTKYIEIIAEKSDFWKAVSKAAAQGALNRFYPPFA